METRGIAPLVVVVIVAAVAGGSVATPVVVDTVDVDPDSPLYALERLGERIKRMDDVSVMKERFMEFSKMCDKGKGSQFLHIQEETERLYSKLQQELPEEKKAEVVSWLSAQEVRVAKNKVQLLKEAALKLKEELKGTAAEEEIGEVVGDLQECSLEVTTRPEEVQARIELLKQMIENIKAPYAARVRVETVKALEAEIKACDFEIKTKVEIKKTRAPPVFDLQKELSEFNTKLAEIKAKLELAPQVPGRKAVEVLVREAEEHRDKALEAAEDNKVRIGLLHSAVVLLERAEKILDRAMDWEEKHAEEWREYKKAENLLEQQIVAVGKTIEGIAAENPEALKAIAVSIRQVGVRLQETVKEMETEYTRKAGEAEDALREGYGVIKTGLEDALTRWTTGGASWWDEAREKGYLVVVLPVRVKITGTVDSEGNLAASFSESRERSIDTLWGTLSVRILGEGTLEARLQEGTVVGNLTARGERSITSKNLNASWTVEISASVSGVVSERMVECDVKGTGKASGTHTVDLGGWKGPGSLEWTQSLSFEVSGKIVGDLIGGNFEGWICLYPTNARTTSFSVVRENIGGVVGIGG